MLQAIDTRWKKLLALAGPSAGRNRSARLWSEGPIREYQRRVCCMFMEMISRIKMNSWKSQYAWSRIQAEGREVEKSGRNRNKDYILSRGEDTPANQTIRHETKGWAE